MVDRYFSIWCPKISEENFSHVVNTVYEMVPSLNVVRIGRIEFNAKGPTGYFGGEEQAAIELINRINKLNIADVFIGIANTRFASFVAARVAPFDGGIHIVGNTKEQTQDFLNIQPLSLIDSPRIIAVLKRVGLSTLGEIASMRSADMLARFGTEGAEIYDLVTGKENIERPKYEPPDPIFEEYVGQDPLTSSEQAGFVAKNLARKMSAKLSENALMCSEVEIQTYLSNGEVCSRIWRVETSALENIIASRVRIQCDQWLLQKGDEEVSYADSYMVADSFVRGITRIVIEAKEVIPLDKRQVSLFGVDVHTDDEALRTIDRVRSIVGDQNVVEVVGVGGRMPQEMVEFREFNKSLDDLASQSYSDDMDLSCSLYWPGAIIGKAPMCNFEPGYKAKLLDKNNSEVTVYATGIMKLEPQFIESPALSPARQEVLNYAGPWPLEDWWWDDTKRRRICRFQILCPSGAYLVITKGKKAKVIARY